MTTVLITEELGVIGTRLVAYLRKFGCDVKVTDNRTAKSPDYVSGDVCSMVETMQGTHVTDPRIEC